MSLFLNGPSQERQGHSSTGLSSINSSSVKYLSNIKIRKLVMYLNDCDFNAAGIVVILAAIQSI
jgi:hypothetical protein